MKKVSKWALCIGFGVMAAAGLTGCNNGGDNADNAVPDSIKSPVMNKANDKAAGGSDSGDATNAAGEAANRAITNSKMSGSVPTPNTSKKP